MTEKGTTVQWPIGRLTLRPDVVASLALSSLKLRVTRSLLTLLTIATASAFLMYLLLLPREADPAERQGWRLMMALSLLVSAAGVLNTMLMAVTQRYREIGTMKCLGALDRFILLSVLVEAAVLGLAGSALGAVAGLAIAGLLAPAGLGEGLALKMAFVFATGLALTLAGAAGPAWLASRMPPMDAMRGEK